MMIAAWCSATSTMAASGSSAGAQAEHNSRHKKLRDLKVEMG